MYSLEDVTKCLNTAVVIMYLYIGDNARTYTQHCDTHNVIPRYEALIKRAQEHNPDSPFNPSALMLNECVKRVFAPSRVRYIYYIMITDCNLVKPDGSKILFPGHVCVLEKTKDTKARKFNLYQSYINQYDLNGHYERNHNSFVISEASLQYVFKELKALLNGTWTPATTAMWKKFTHVDSPQFEGLLFKNHVHFCFRKVTTCSCEKHLVNVVNHSLQLKTNQKDVTLLQQLQNLKYDLQRH